MSKKVRQFEEVAKLYWIYQPLRTPGPRHPAPASRAESLNEEVSDFITRQVIEKDTQFFDG